MRRLLLSSLFIWLNWLVALSAEPFTEFERDDAASAFTLAVDAAKPAPFVLPPTLFGTFIENIWDAVYGGVWAQILHNPSFEADYLSASNVLDAVRYGRLVTDPSFGSGFVRVEPLVQDPQGDRFAKSSALGLPLPWEPLRNHGARYEPREGDAANSQRALLLMGLEGKEVEVRQGVYLPAERVLEFSGSISTKLVAGSPAALTLSVRRRDQPDEVLAQTVVQVSAKTWECQEFALHLSAGKIRPLEKVDFCLSMRGETRVLLDQVLLWPTDHIEGFDPEVLAAARSLRTPLLRFGGNFSSGYHWQDGIGPSAQRRTLLNQAWGLPEYNHFGTDEFIRLCRLIGAEPQICVNAGSGEPEEAAAWVEYCNGAATTKYGAMRAANGHPEPHRVRFWEVGNELWGDFQIGWQTAASNARRYVEFARAMRQVDPAIRLIATGGDVDFFELWNRELIRQTGARLDLVSTHLVIGMQPSEQQKPGADDAFTHAADLAVPVGIGRKLDEMRAQLATAPAKIAFTEWQFWSPRAEDPRFMNLGGAVNTAAFFQMLARRADFVPLSNMSNLTHFAGIHRQRGRVFQTPSCDVFRLYAHSAGYRPVAVKTRGPAYEVQEGNRRVPNIPHVPEIDALALLSPDARELRIHLVNRSLKKTVPAEVALTGFQAQKEATRQQLGAANLATANSPEEPRKVVLVSSKLSVEEDRLHLELPPHSVNVVTLAVADAPPEVVRRSVLITTDCGAEMDDQWTIAQAVVAPEFEVLGIVTTHAPSLPSPAAEASARSAREVLANLPLRFRPPVLAGSSFRLPDAARPLRNSGVNFLLAESRSFSPENRLAVLILGAATDVASALLLDPSLADRIELVAMAFDRWPEGGDSWNVKNDPAAWQVLLASLAPLVIGDALVTKRDLALSRGQVAALMSPLGEPGTYLARLHSAWLDRDPPFVERVSGDAQTWPIWDQVAVAWLLGLTETKPVPRFRLEDDLRFTTAADAPERPAISWVTRISTDALWKHFTKNLEAARLRSAREVD